MLSGTRAWVFAALALLAMPLASAHAAGGVRIGVGIGFPVFYRPYYRPVYVAPAPVYYAPAPVYVEEPVCRFVRERYWDGYGWVYRRVEVCD